MIKIGKNIRKLRENNNLTQEKLANYLDVTPQAISRWEGENGYPDIEILPLIANFFNVTIDELLDRDKETQEKEIKDGIKEIERLSSNGLEDERNKLIYNLYCKYPFNYKIIEYYMWMIIYDDSDKIHEIEKLGNLILEKCLDDKIRYSAIICLSNYYDKIGNQRKALKLLEKLPKDYRNTYNEQIEYFYGEYSKEGIAQRKENIEELADLLCWKIMLQAGLRSHKEDEYSISVEESIELYKKALKIFEIIYDERDYHFYNSRLETIEWELYRLYKSIGDIQSSQFHLEEAKKYAKLFDELRDKEEYKSILVRGNIYRKEKTSKSSPKTHVKIIEELLNQ